MPPNTVKVTRPGPYGNPFVVGEQTTGYYKSVFDGKVTSAAQAVELFRRALIENLLKYDASVDILLKLRGKNLACWCPLADQPCHADVLLELANLPPPNTGET